MIQVQVEAEGEGEVVERRGVGRDTDGGGTE